MGCLCRQKKETYCVCRPCTLLAVIVVHADSPLMFLFLAAALHMECAEDSLSCVGIRTDGLVVLAYRDRDFCGVYATPLLFALSLKCSTTYCHCTAANVWLGQTGLTCLFISIPG